MRRPIATLGFIVFISSAFTQTAGTLTFEVASVRRNSTTAGSYLHYYPGGRLSASSWTKQLIEIAYGLKNYQVTGGPDWLTTDWYAIEAKAPNPDATKNDLNTMLQVLLIDRFKLRLRQETKDFDSFDLVLDKGGSRLTPLKDGEMSQCSRDNSVMCGMTNVSDIAQLLTSVLGRPVFDKTGIAGRFDLLLDFDTYSAQGRIPPEGLNKPSVNTALKEQLGLKLERRKVPLPILVVEGVERPTDN